MTENPTPQSPVVSSYPEAIYPTDATLAARHNLVLQFGKFAMFNLRLMWMVLEGHDEHPA